LIKTHQGFDKEKSSKIITKKTQQSSKPNKAHNE
jgi:hypothetical protein